MKDNSRNQQGKDLQTNPSHGSDPSNQDNRQSVSNRDLEKSMAEKERRDRLTTNKPDNYERDAE